MIETLPNSLGTGRRSGGTSAMPFRTIEISDPTLTPPGFHFITVQSPALRQRADLTVYVPASADPRKPLPTVTLLHGVYGSHWAWAFKGGAHAILEKLIAAGRIQPMALLMPSDGLWGDGSAYMKHGDRDYASWIVDEVAEAAAQADARLADGPRFICGLSMGGFGALRLGALHPETFTAFSGLSSATDLTQLEDLCRQSGFHYNLAPGQARTVLEAILANRAQLRPFRFDCGSNDFLIEPNRRLHRELTTAGIAHRYVENPGEHIWPYWQKHLGDSLEFFAEILAKSS